MNLFAVINQLISLFLMMLLGFIAARAGIITPDFRKRLSSFTLNTAAPCIIISSVLESESNPLKMLGAAGMGVFFFVIMIVFSAAIVRVLRIKKEERGINVDYSAEVSNRLSLALGRKVKLVDGKKTGKIELEFYGADDRELLIEALEKLSKK